MRKPTFLNPLVRKMELLFVQCEGGEMSDEEE